MHNLKFISIIISNVYFWYRAQKSIPTRRNINVGIIENKFSVLCVVNRIFIFPIFSKMRRLSINLKCFMSFYAQCILYHTAYIPYNTYICYICIIFIIKVNLSLQLYFSLKIFEMCVKSIMWIIITAYNINVTI